MLYVLNTEEEVRMDENIIKGLENEGIYLEGKLCDNELIGLERVIRLINDKKLQELDVCEEMMRVIAKDCIELLKLSGGILEERDGIKEINESEFQNYWKNNAATKYRENPEGVNNKRVCFLDNYIEYLKPSDIMVQRTIEEIGVKLFTYDPDISLVIIYIYCKLLQKKDGFKKVLIKHNKSYRYKIHFFDNNDDKNMIYCGDTMTSWWTSLKAFLNFPKKIAHENFFSDMDISSEMKERKEFREIDSKEVKKFMKAVYTIGNFCPVPEGFNGARSGGGHYDYWDLTLMKIHDWYMDENEKHLNDLLHIKTECSKNEERRKNCKEWLEWFKEDAKRKRKEYPENYCKGYDGWHNFVDTLYMQDYVYNEDNWDDKRYKDNKENREYYDVIPFWRGHEWSKEGIKFPTGDDEIKDAFETMTAIIKARSNRIVEALRNAKK